MSLLFHPGNILCLLRLTLSFSLHVSISCSCLDLELIVSILLCDIFADSPLRASEKLGHDTLSDRCKHIFVFLLKIRILISFVVFALLREAGQDYWLLLFARGRQIWIDLASLDGMGQRRGLGRKAADGRRSRKSRSCESSG
jgi:hypothetical protein